MLKASSALAGFLLAPQVALAQAVPTGLEPTDGEDSQVGLTWTDPSDNTIQSYKVRYRKYRESTWTESAIPDSSATTTSHTVTGLENGYGYYLQICAVRSGTCSGWSNSAQGEPSAPSIRQPAKPTGLSATGGDRSVTLSWTDSGDRSIVGYQYQQRSEGVTGSWDWMPDGTLSTITSSKITGLTNGTPYSFRIRANNNHATSSQSPATDWVTATPAVPTPGFTVSPTSLTIDEGSSDTYTVKLNAAPGSNVVVTVGGESGDVTVSGSPLTFTPANYSSPQTVTVNAGGDADTTDDTATLTHSYTGGGDTYSSISIDSVTVTVTDTGTTPTPGVSTPTVPATPSTPSTPSSPSSPSTPARTTVPTAPAFQLLSDPAAVREGEPITLEVTSSSPLTDTQVVSLSLSDRESSGFAAGDIPGSLGPRSFNAEFGSSPSKTGRVTIPTSRDAVVEGRESYRITLRARSGYSLGKDVTADGTLLHLPAKPRGLTATGGNAQVTLSWDDPQDVSISGWQVKYKEGDGSDGSWEDIPNSSASTTGYTVTGLRNGTRYEFRLRAVNSAGAGEVSDEVRTTTLHPGTARGTQARKISLTGLSRATLSSATDVIGGRIRGELTTTTASDGSIGEQALGIVEDVLGISGTALPSSLSIESIGEQLWHQTFQLSPAAATTRTTADGERAQATNTTAERQRSWALWGAGNLQRFSGEDGQEPMSYEGNLKTAWVGIDQQFRAPWRGGVAASFALGESDYRYKQDTGEGAGGTIKTRLTTFYPYGSVQVNERLRLWGTAGVGFGELRHQESNADTDTQRQEQEGDLRMQLAVLGFAQQLSSLGTWDFSLAGDMGLIKTSSQWADHSGLEDLSITLTRARLGVDSSFPLSESTRGYVNLRGRLDGGEQQLGAAEAVAGLQYSAARLSALLQGRQTYALNGDYSESGITGQLLFSSQEDGTGLALELQPSYGHYGEVSAQQQPFFFDDAQLQALTGQSSSQQDGGLGLKSMLGYGFRPHDADLLLTPFAELSFSQGRRYLLGVGLNMEAPPWEVKLTGSREETGNTSPTGKLQLLFSTQL